MSSLLSLAPMALSFVPGIGPLAAAGITAGLGAGRGLLSGQGPFTSLGQGLIQGGTQYGFNQLGNALNNSNSIAGNTTFGDPNQFTLARSQPLSSINPGTFSINTAPSPLIDNLIGGGYFR